MIERVSATAISAVADAQLGNLAEARARIFTASDAATTLSTAEVTLETARIELEFGSADSASLALRRFRPDQHSRGHEGLFNLLAGELALREGNLELARGFTGKLGVDRCADAAGKLRAQILCARISLAEGRSEASSDADEASRIARAQNTPRGEYVARLLGSFSRHLGIDDAILQGADSDAYCWSVLAEELTERLHLLSPAAIEHVLGEVRARPERWQHPLRRAMRQPRRPLRGFFVPRRYRHGRRCHVAPVVREQAQGTPRSGTCHDPATCREGADRGLGTCRGAQGWESASTSLASEGAGPAVLSWRRVREWQQIARKR